MKSVTHLLRWSFLVTFVVSMEACTPSDLDYISDYDVVYTNYDKQFNFTGINTYFMPDSVVHVVAPGTDADHRFDAQILATLKSNLDALGWTRLPVNGGDKADVVVLPLANETGYASCAAYCWYCYWGWYPGWGYYPPVWGPGWGWGYPADIVCTTYSTGTVAVSITNPNTAANDKLPVLWLGIMNGLLEGSDSSVDDRIEKSINQMFVQSPYLK